MTSKENDLSKLTHNLIKKKLMTIVPGSDERKLKSSLSLAADCLVYDLEDGVAHNRKNIAREMVFDALEASEHRKAEKAVRINAVGSGLEFDDLNVVVMTRFRNAHDVFLIPLLSI